MISYSFLPDNENFYNSRVNRINKKLNRISGKISDALIYLRFYTLLPLIIVFFKFAKLHYSKVSEISRKNFKFLNEDGVKKLFFQIDETLESLNELAHSLYKIRQIIPNVLLLDVIDCRDIVADLEEELIKIKYPNQGYLSEEEKERYDAVGKQLADLV